MRTDSGLSQEANLQNVCIDSAVIRTHAYAAGAAASNTTDEDEVLNRSRGGFGCKTHAPTDALDLPVRSF